MALSVDLYAWRSALRALLGLLLFVAAVAIVARAYEPLGASAEGAGTVSGYEMSGIEYSLLASDPSRVDGINFEVTANKAGGVPRQVTVSVDDGGHWITCLPAGGFRWTCPLQASVRELTSLRVAAVQ